MEILKSGLSTVSDGQKIRSLKSEFGVIIIRYLATHFIFVIQSGCTNKNSNFPHSSMSGPAFIPSSFYSPLGNAGTLGCLHV